MFGYNCVYLEFGRRGSYIVCYYWPTASYVLTRQPAWEC